MKTKQELIRASARILFGKFGVKRTSIDQIVEKAGVAKGTFYLYFKKKEELYQDIVRNNFKESKKILFSALEKIEDIQIKMMKKMMMSLIFFEKDEIIRNILLENKDYETQVVTKDYICKLHVEFIQITFQSHIDLDYTLISKIMGFYVNVINIKSQFKNENEYLKFCHEFSAIIVRGIFSDYKDLGTNYKNYSLKKQDETTI